MGYIVLAAQLRAIQQLLDELTHLDSMELLWLPGGLQIVGWHTDGTNVTYVIDEDGGILNGN